MERLQEHSAGAASVPRSTRLAPGGFTWTLQALWSASKVTARTAAIARGGLQNLRQ